MIRFLLVDDHEMVRRGAKLMLVEGFPECEVALAADAGEALQQLSSQSWDLLLLDLNLPGRNGFELLGEVKRRWPELPVLVVSSYPEEQFAVRSIQLGAAGYLTKAAVADELVTAVRKTLDGGRYVTATVAEQLATVLAGAHQPRPHDALSKRELQVLRMVASGRSQREVAAELRLSEKTIATYRARIAEKLGVSTAVELTRYAVRHKLVD